MRKSIFWLTLSALTLAPLSVSAQKLSADTELLLFKHQHKQSADRKLQSLSVDPTRPDSVIPDEIGVFIHITGQEVVDQLRAKGCAVNSVFGNIVTAEVAIDRLRDIATLSGVKFIQAGQPVTLKNYNTRRRVKVNEIHNQEGELPAAYRGKGVVVGIIDLGFQYNHKAFRTYDGTDRLRIARVWNQTAVGTHPAGYNYGREMTSAEEIIQAITDSQSEFHGSHTAGTAAGSDADSPFYGMAPDAELVLVSVNLASNTAIADGIKYIFDYAESQGKPAVVNMSLGSQLGPHDGDSSLDQVIESLVGPGRIVVGAVGNEGGDNIHCSKTFTADDTTLKTMMAYADGSGKNATTVTEIRATPGTNFTVEVAIVDPTRKGRIVKTTGEFSPGEAKTIFKNLSEGNTTDINITVASASEIDGSAPQLLIQSECLNLAANRKQAFIVHGENGQTVHLWNATTDHYFIDGSIDGFTKGDNDYTVGEIGGTGRGVISVGSYDSDSLLVLSRQYEIKIPPLMNDIGMPFETDTRSSFSSCGPTVDGRMKPEVLAPGCWIISAFNNNYIRGEIAKSYIEPSTDAQNTKYYYEMSFGTSQATPVVTGTIALWLEANPNLSPDDIREVLSRTCDRDIHTGSSPNNQSGYGKLNAYAGIRDILGLSSAIDNVTLDEEPAKVWYDASARQIYCVATGASVATVADMSGRVIGSFTITPDARTIDASAFAPGVYIVNVAAQGSATSAKLLIR